MRDQREQQKASSAIAIELLTQAMMGFALGVLCAGLLMLTHQIDLTAFIKVKAEWVARLIFLMSFGISFALGATLTGAALLVARVFKQ
jgi:hypothetical protein